MSLTTRTFNVAATVLIAAVSLASSAAAQTVGDCLAPRAVAVHTTPADWITTARTLVKTAAARPAGDPCRFNDLIAAANAYRIGGQLNTARRTALQAALGARRAADGKSAAHAYLAAAIVSAEMNDGAAANEYLDRARKLAPQAPVKPVERNFLAQGIR